MLDKCFICDKPLEAIDVFLCKKHTIIALEVLLTGVYKGEKYKIYENSQYMQHCGICGEWENRIIINYPKWNYLCDRCIEKAREAYNL